MNAVGDHLMAFSDQLAPEVDPGCMALVLIHA